MTSPLSMYLSRKPFNTFAERGLVIVVARYAIRYKVSHMDWRWLLRAIALGKLIMGYKSAIVCHFLFDLVITLAIAILRSLESNQSMWDTLYIQGLQL